MSVYNINYNFLSNLNILISYLTHATLFLKSTEANLSINKSLQYIDKNNIYAISLKPQANSSTYFLDRDPDHTFVNVANKEFILCKLVRELNFSYDAINSWYLRPVSKMEQKDGVGTIDTNDCPEDFIINLHHIREIKDFVSNINISKIGNILTTYMIGGSEYNLTNKNNNYYMVDSNFDLDSCLLPDHINDCASFKVSNDSDASLLNILYELCADNIKYCGNIVVDNPSTFTESILYAFLQGDEIETEQKSISIFNVSNIGAMLGVIGVSLCGIYTANKIKTYIQTKYHHNSYNKYNSCIEHDQNNIECVGEGTELQEILS